MLVIGRKIGEVIVVECGGRLIEVVVADIKGSKVRIGITAPRDVTIVRKEIAEDEVPN